MRADVGPFSHGKARGPNVGRLHFQGPAEGLSGQKPSFRAGRLPILAALSPQHDGSAPRRVVGTSEEQSATSARILPSLARPNSECLRRRWPEPFARRGRFATGPRHMLVRGRVCPLIWRRFCFCALNSLPFRAATAALGLTTVPLSSPWALQGGCSHARLTHFRRKPPTSCQAARPPLQPLWARPPGAAFSIAAAPALHPSNRQRDRPRLPRMHGR